MEKQRMDLWRQRLLDEEARLTEQIKQVETGDIDEPYAAQSILNVSRNLLSQVRYAIRRCDLGTYGTCEICAHDIEEDRLAVVPYATTCSTCAHEAQLMGKMRQEMAQRGYVIISGYDRVWEGKRNGRKHIARF